MGYRVAVVGATGNVGREILNILAERQFPLDELAAVASARSTGDIIDFGDSGEELKVKNLEHFDFAGRSEERRVGKECRSRWLSDILKQKIPVIETISTEVTKLTMTRRNH